ncbi:MAG: DNA primase [Jaaginema sp. PMC 1079.18]|nr:DNA primase [Jaaginema sp. PMC 1080.18]MEC4852085.1 DNA primase [Jaaginema sp. PMC 1079.18]MEC4865514.1 DNA primase [Jaaginema sp. PMC 1078.18]
MDVPRLHPDTLEEVKQRVDIVDVISDYVVLRKQGRDLLGLCPFHDEKSPSFSVSPSKQLYYCFGCGTGGNAISFLMEIDKARFSDVVLNLASRYQIPVQTLEPAQHQELQRQLSLREQLYEILAVAASFYQHCLRQPQGELALSYLQNERALTLPTIQQFALGYAPAGWDTLYRYLVETKRFAVSLVEQAGLIRKRKTGDGYYDYFRDRVAIPIADSQGKVIGFGTRSLNNSEPKYLNSPETPLFVKSKTLFALDLAKSTITKQDCAIVVEGYFDAIALHSHGISNAVASLGTAFTPDHLKALLRYTTSKQVIFNFDADNAGTKATQRTLNENEIESLIYSGSVQLRVLNLPGGKDADEFLKSSPEAVTIYQQKIAEAPLWLDWQIEQFLQDKDIKQADQFEQVAQNMVKLLNKIEDRKKRSHYLSHCAKLLSHGDTRLFSMYLETLQRELKKPRLKASQDSPETSLDLLTSPEHNTLDKAEKTLLSIYLHYPHYRDTIFELLDEKELFFSNPNHRLVWHKILEAQAVGQHDLILTLQTLNLQYPEQVNPIYRLLFLNETQTEDINRPLLVIHCAIARLEQVNCESLRRNYVEKLQNLNHETHFQLMQQYYQEIQKLDVQITNLKLQNNISHADLTTFAD